MMSERTRLDTAIVDSRSRLRFWAFGDPGAPTVVCIHGVTLDHGTFAAQVLVMRDAGYRVITWDLRGHGRNQPMGESFSFRTAADDLGALLNEVGVDRAVLVGQSFGGFVAQELCRRTPERVSALVLIGTPALGDRPPWPYRALQRMRPLALRLWPEGHLRRVLPGFMSVKPEVQRYVAQATRPLTKAALITFTRAALEALAHHERTSSPAIPALLTHGDREDAVVARMIRAWAARDPLAQCKIIHNAGHLANQDNPVAFNCALLDFLEQNRLAGTGGSEGPDRVSRP